MLKRTEPNLQTTLIILARQPSSTRLQSCITFLSSIPWVHILLNSTFASKQKVTKLQSLQSVSKSTGIYQLKNNEKMKEHINKRDHVSDLKVLFFHKPSLMGSYRTKKRRMPSSHRLPVSHDEPQSLTLDMLVGGWGGTTPNLLGSSFLLATKRFCCSRRSRFFHVLRYQEGSVGGGSGFSMMVPWLSIFVWIMMTWQHMLLRNMALFQFFT